ncbi:DUF89 domain-containing protein [Acidobacteriota bacterium]
MLADNHCVGCVLNQVIRVCEYAGVNQGRKDLIFKKALQRAAEIDLKKMSSPEFAEKIYRVFSDISGEKDPYEKLRKEQNDLILDKIDFFREKIRDSSDPLKKSAIYSLTGNIIDYGAVRLFNPGELFQHFDDVQLSIDDYTEFRRRLRKGGKILIIGDNAGEAVFDRLFIEEMRRFNPSVTIVYGVRSAPAINDMLEEDARYIGLDKVAEVVKTGSTFAGTDISKSTKQFQKIYHNADIVISKGQGNFETLEEEGRDILFILKVKCEVVARHANLKLGSRLFAFNNTLKAGRVNPTGKAGKLGF